MKFFKSKFFIIFSSVVLLSFGFWFYIKETTQYSKEEKVYVFYTLDKKDKIINIYKQDGCFNVAQIPEIESSFIKTKVSIKTINNCPMLFKTISSPVYEIKLSSNSIYYDVYINDEKIPRYNKESLNQWLFVISAFESASEVTIYWAQQFF